MSTVTLSPPNALPTSAKEQFTQLANAAGNAAPSTLADLVHRLGDVPLERIRTQPGLGTATETDVVSNKHCELIDGVLVETAMGWEESTLATELIRLIGNYLSKNRIAVLAGPDGPTRVTDLKVRIPDVGVYLLSDFPGGKAKRAAICDVAPAWAIEVLSRGNTPEEMRLKREQFFDAGTRRFWIVNPRRRTVEDWTSSTTMQLLSTQDIADVGAILPGFTMNLAEVFTALDAVLEPEGEL